MIKKFDFDYDYENDSLFLYDPKSKSKASVEFDDLIIDYNSKKELSAVELLGASKFFSDFGSKQASLSKANLRGILECSIEVIPRKNFFVIKFCFLLKSNKKITAPLLIPSINEQSPAVAI